MSGVICFRNFSVFLEDYIRGARILVVAESRRYRLDKDGDHFGCSAR